MLDVHLKFQGELKKASVWNFDSIPFDRASGELNAEVDRISKIRLQVPKGRVLFEEFQEREASAYEDSYYWYRVKCTP